MRILAIETSCDETAVALLDDGKVLADLIATQGELHSPYGGIVPELASRRQMELLPSMVADALAQCGWSMADIEGIAVTRAPGLIGALLVGLSFAKALAFANGTPLVGVNHLEGHLHAVRVEHPEFAYPYLGLVVSGGHTSLYHVRAFGDYRLLGATRDDAAGEAFDKVAKLLGLGYPGGPLIDRLATQGEPTAFRFGPPKLDPDAVFQVGEYDFSFSGVKTAVARIVQGWNKNANTSRHSDLAASFQAAVVDQLCRRLHQAARAYNCSRLVVSGGVAANQGLRQRLGDLAQKEGYQIAMPPIRYCTDNAVMIGIVGAEYLARGVRHGPELNAAAVEELGR
ncbi:MAG: tRNA (adenosine(37)-N6)-threonylcarbamoyltransferase complex transferase subunit TsaD [Deltaproteobacteria bacterium]|nr:tRNA (adenosine(37)-N6)-threonylcarbamoyltransferase complex transferase subunit TsaD [Deltaproteobacteria bacterium]